MSESSYTRLFGYSSAMRALLGKIQCVADTTATVLIRGESGVGKELVAKAIHQASPRASRPFVKVNCAALPADLLESEMFGHERGSFTGAFRRKPGKFELAEGGTIFLDEIGDMPIQLQAKLLHVLQDQEFMRVGGGETVRVDVRVIAATNRELESAVRANVFREDLYYRLKVVMLFVPPLRERRNEIIPLARAFVARFNAEFGRAMVLGPDALAALQRYSWPGNVRELENLIKSAVVLEDERALTAVIDGAGGVIDHVAPATGEPGSPPALRDVGRRAAAMAQRDVLRAVLDQVHWNRAEAARRLGVSYKTLLYKMDQCGLGRKRPNRPATGT